MSEEIREMDGWISAKDWCDRYGERPNTIHVRVSRGIWKRGVHYSAPDAGRFFVHEARCVEWLKGQRA